MMTMHPGRDVLLAHADGELANDEEGELVRHHLEDCTQCSAAMGRLRDDCVSFAATLHALDESEPAHWVTGYESGRMPPARHNQVETAPSTRAHEAGVLPLRPRSGRAAPSRSPWLDGLRWAAGILLVAGATVSAAVVGARVLSDPAATPATREGAVSVEPAVAAVMVSPVAGRVVVAVSGAGAESRLFVAFADRADASVAVEGTGSPRFRAEDGRVDLDLGGASAVVRLTLPRSLPQASVTANGTRIVTVQDGQVLPPAAGAAGVPLATGSRME